MHTSRSLAGLTRFFLTEYCFWQATMPRSIGAHNSLNSRNNKTEYFQDDNCEKKRAKNNFCLSSDRLLQIAGIEDTLTDWETNISFCAIEKCVTTFICEKFIHHSIEWGWPYSAECWWPICIQRSSLIDNGGQHYREGSWWSDDETNADANFSSISVYLFKKRKKDSVILITVKNLSTIVRSPSKLIDLFLPSIFNDCRSSA